MLDQCYNQDMCSKSSETNKNKYIKMKTSSYVAPPFVHLMKLDPFCIAPLNSFPQAHGWHTLRFANGFGLCKSCWGASSGAERNALLAGQRGTSRDLDSSPMLQLQKAFALSVLSLWLSPNDVKLQYFLQMLYSFQPRKQWDVLLLFFIFNP